MDISNEARVMVGVSMVLVPTIEYGGYFLLTELQRTNGVIRTALQGSYFRAGHAHAGVLVILGIIAQLLIDVPGFAPAVAWPLRIGFVVSPMLVSAGFFLGAPTEGTHARPLIRLVYLGAVVLALALLVLGLGLIFGA